MASGLPPPSSSSSSLSSSSSVAAPTVSSSSSTTTTPVPSSSSAPTVSSSSSATASSLLPAKEKTNHIKLSTLLIDVGRRVLQDVFDAIHPPSTLNALLCSGPVHNALSILKSKKILYMQQWNTLYPGSGGSAHASSANFDVTLLFLLLRNICSLASPATGWGLPPLPSDQSMEADLVRIKLCRNEVYAHTLDLTLSDANFETNWNDIKTVLIRLGGSKYEAEIERLKVDSIDVECENTFKVLLQKWEEGDEKILDAMRRQEETCSALLQSQEEGVEKILEAVGRQEQKVDLKDTGTNLVEIIVKGLVKIVTIGGVVLSWAAGSAYFLNRYSDDPEMVIRLVQEAIIPSGVLTGAIVAAIVKGSFVIKIHVSSLEALDQIWESYKTGEMERRLETIIVTDDLKALAPDDVENIIISISISEDDYEKARGNLAAKHNNENIAKLLIETEEIDLSQIPVSIPWTSYSTKHEAKLASVARRQNFEQIGTYLFHQKPIGSGSFGHVFAGINEKDGSEIAIKKIEKLRMVRPEDKREIRNLTALADCQQVVTYIYFDDSDKNFAYIVLELMEGNLDDYFASSFFHPRQSPLLCKDVVMGLRYLHDCKPKPILHRDLKPNNILFKDYPKICLKIADFGLSSPLTTTGTTVLMPNVGPRCWIAPEVVRSDTHEHSMASDNYSCGLLLHYILSGQKHPFSPADCSNITREIIDHGTQTNMLNSAMDSWDDKLSPEATHLIKGLLSSNVAERPSAADSLSHPLFWTNKKKMALLSAVGNQPEIECPRPASGPLNAVESDLEAEFSRIVQHSTWVDASFTYMPSIYTEITKPIVKGKAPPRKPRLYNTGSVVELVQFIRNSIAHVSDAHRASYVRKQILEDAVFLVEFPHLVIEVFKIVTKHGWDTREEIKHAMSSE